MTFEKNSALFAEIGFLAILTLIIVYASPSNSHTAFKQTQFAAH
jgi:hypothetical protein